MPQPAPRIPETCRCKKTLGHASAGDVIAGRTTEWERRGNREVDTHARMGVMLHGLSRETLDRIGAVANLALQAARWSAEAFVSLQRRLPPAPRRARASNGLAGNLVLHAIASKNNASDPPAL